MGYEQKQDTGSLFRNERKEKPNHPDYEGTANYNGEVFRIAGWINEIKSGKNQGKKYLSLKLSRPRDAQDQRRDDDDSIPF